MREMQLTTAERAEILVKKRGYIVLASPQRQRIGKIIHEVSSGTQNMGGFLLQPFAIISETNREDAEEQQRILIEHGDDPPSIINNAYWYRLSTD